MKKLIYCLLVVMMLISAVNVFAEPIKPVEKSNVLTEFLKETDFAKQDIALQAQSGDQATDLVVRSDGTNIHLVSRENNVEKSHVQFDPTGIYLSADGSVTLLRYATVTTVMQNVVNAVNSVLDEIIKNIPEIPEEMLPSEAEVAKAINEMAIVAQAVETQEQADAATLNSAAMSFADKFKPEYILDVKGDEGSLEISLRGQAFASALAEAMDELMTNEDLAKLVDRNAEDADESFAAAQLEWLENRDAFLEEISTMESTGKIDEDGHYVSHFQIGEETQETKILVCDTDAWVDAEDGEIESVVYMGFKDEDPFIEYRIEASPNHYRETMISGDSYTDIHFDYEDNKLTTGEITTVIEGKEEFRTELGSDYLYMKGPKGGISSSVRETWLGKLRYELVAETADGKESSFTVDFYEDWDSLVCELYTNESDQSAKFMISRVDKLNIEDLSASKNINEITVDSIKAELENLVKMALSAKTTDAVNAK